MQCQDITESMDVVLAHAGRVSVVKLVLQCIGPKATSPAIISAARVYRMMACRSLVREWSKACISITIHIVREPISFRLSKDMRGVLSVTRISVGRYYCVDR